jgi:hypothetical protein
MHEEATRAHHGLGAVHQYVASPPSRRRLSTRVAVGRFGWNGRLKKSRLEMISVCEVSVSSTRPGQPPTPTSGRAPYQLKHDAAHVQRGT